ncbi:polyprenyl synthetase family protein [Streptomyces sp. NPDC002838]|uniref:polyprenyl synthetase family protein n=1 Tax=Streptomyces sp. NPDC002838 TaxID=3154436 RepID=UPI003318B1AD
MSNTAAQAAALSVPSPMRVPDTAPAPFGTPHTTVGMEWWYLHGHVRTDDGHEHHWAFLLRRHEDVHTPTADAGYSCIYTHSGPAGAAYDSWITSDCHRTVRQVISGDAAIDPRVRNALGEALAEGPLLPDRLLDGPVKARDTELDIVVGDVAKLRREEDGSYIFTVRSPEQPHLDLTLVPDKPSTPQFHEDGHLPGRFPDGADAVTTHVLPRLKTHGTLTTPQGTRTRVEGKAWFEQTWGGASGRAEREPGISDPSWQWAGIQLDNGWEISAIQIQYVAPVTADVTRSTACATALAPDGTVSHHDLTWQPTRHWTSAATLNTYPTAVRVSVADLGLEVEVTAPAAAHEIPTMAVGRAGWESPAHVTGTMGAEPVTGMAFLETVPANTINDIEHYTRRAFAIAHEEAAAVYPATADGDLAALTGTDQGPRLDRQTRRRLHENLAAPVRHLLDVPGRAWRPVATTAVFCLFGADPEPYRPLIAACEIMHTASMIIDDIEDSSPLRRGRPTVHTRFGTPTAINAGTTAYFAFDAFLPLVPEQDPAIMLRVYQVYLRGLRAAHAGQALDLAGHRASFEHAVATGDPHLLLEQIRTAHRLKTGMPVRAVTEAAALIAGADEEQIQAVGHYFETVGTVYQISDDVADLDGVTTAEDRRQGQTAKVPAEDLLNGEVTYPVAHATGLLDATDRRRLRNALYEGTPAGAARAAELLTHSGALEACLTETRQMIDAAWTPLEPLLPRTQHKALIRALGWYAAQRVPDPAGDTPCPYPR